MTNTRNHITLQPAYVLHGRPYRDTSLLLEVLTPDYGRIGLVARGVRSARSRLRGVLQPFRPLLMSWNGGGDLGTLTGAEAPVEEGNAGAGLAGGSLMSGFYLNELLLRLLHRHDPHPALFHGYGLALRKLSLVRDDVALQQALRIFEKELLQDTGYGLVLDHDVVTGQPVAADGMYRYHMEKGPERIIPAAAHGILPPAALAEPFANALPCAAHVANTLGMVLHGHTLLGLARNELRDVINLHEAKQLLRKILAVHLGQRPLRSRELYSEMLAGASL